MGLFVRNRNQLGECADAQKKANGKNHYGQMSRQFLTIRATFTRHHSWTEVANAAEGFDLFPRHISQ